MSVPLDRLYNFLDSINDHNLIIYRWTPHGSKNIDHLLSLKNPGASPNLHYAIRPIMICHDQEPVELDQLSDKILDRCITQWKTSRSVTTDPPHDVMDFFKKQLNLRLITGSFNAYDYIILLHSELKSQQVEQSQNWYVPVYYWSHALIARDWYRYAELDPVLQAPKKYTHDFLIYNRAWTGTREYRLKFSELIINSQLDQHCKMGFSVVDQGSDYRSHKFKNQNLQISNHNIQNYFFDNQTPSTASADYDSADYQSCAIEVVLETLFDDSRIHLTEKVLRPIACGHPFILVSTAGSLEYLRHYGFKTFQGLINEDYDQLLDPADRLVAIVKVMKDIAKMSSDDKDMLFQEMSKISKYNQDRFFSDDFQNYVIQEFKHNIDAGMKKMYQNRTGKYFREKIKFIADAGRRPWPALMSRQECAEIWKWIHKHN
jgi:hypothetical protein